MPLLSRDRRAAVQAELVRRVAATTEAAPWAFHALTTAIGFTAGSVLVLPAVLFMTGHLGGAAVVAQKPAIVMTRSVVARVPAEDATPVAPAVSAAPSPASTASLVAAPEPTPAAVVPPAAEQAAVSAPPQPPTLLSAPRPAERPAPSPEMQARQAALALAERLSEARNLVSDGEIARARELLAEPEVAEQGEALFLMGETYDPNVLAALGVTSMKAEVGRARHLYEMALAAGFAGAKRRLDDLQ